MWHKALASPDLAVGTLAKVFVEGRPILLARLDDGSVTASSAICPHRGEDLSKGMIYFGGIDCSWHHYVYDLRTGANRYPRDVFPADMKDTLKPLPIYQVKEEDGWIWVGPRES